ncbi:MAG: hypothetical protein A3F17_06135 [Gammaproteobacteria bacterium RIFCSPHIGHO2_12_FULL_41_15]|nr:MAG: hypothetical protein A3F17_06135 [Gammaproteobacteria bacterium RIFCSPHIGHO2_12_FULL_41_15]
MSNCVTAVSSLVILVALSTAQCANYLGVTGDVFILKAQPDYWLAKTAKDKVDAAIKLYKTGGMSAVIAAYGASNTSTSYLTVQNENGFYLLGNPKLGEMKKGANAKSVILSGDSTAQYQPVWQAALKKPIWVHINWINPSTMKVQPAVFYVKIYDHLMFSSGFYEEGLL